MGHKFTKILPPNNADGTPLFIGTVDYIVQETILSELGIKAIVTLLPAIPPETYAIIRTNGLDPDSDHLLFPLEDCSEAYVSIFKGMGILSVVDWIHSKRLEGKPVLVHCDAGAYDVFLGFVVHHSPFSCGEFPAHGGSGKKISGRLRTPLW